MPSYKLTFGDRVLTYPGWNGYVGYGGIPYQRYEKTIYRSSNGLGTSAGTVEMPFSAFDEIGIRCCWDGSRATHGCNWLWFPKSTFTAATGNTQLNYMIANDSNYFIFQSNMNWDNANKTFNVLNDQSTKYWGMISPINTTATIAATNNGSRHKIVGEIVGVKYQ